MERVLFFASQSSYSTKEFDLFVSAFVLVLKPTSEKSGLSKDADWRVSLSGGSREGVYSSKRSIFFLPRSRNFVLHR